MVSKEGRSLFWRSPVVTVVLMVISAVPFSHGYTNDQDVFAINSLYAALGSPPLPGWVLNGGDPCTEAWQGIQCIGQNITSIIINGANLGGQLGDQLGNFSSIRTLDLSNNFIGGTIPANLPLTLQAFFLSSNQFTGSIPGSLSKLTQLLDMSVNANNLSGELPDAFQSLTSLINLDLSSNNLSGHLPTSMGGLASLTTLHMQNNKLSGTLDVLGDLPLKDLNVENNQFSGPIPEKLLSIPTFKNDGNPFNTTVAPSSAPPIPPSPSFWGSPVSESPVGQNIPKNSSEGPPSQNSSPTGKKKSTSTVKIIGYVLAGVVSFIIIILAVLFCLSKLQERRPERDELPVRQQLMVPQRPEGPKTTELSSRQNEHTKNASKQASVEPKQENEINMTRGAAKVDSETKKFEFDRIDSGILLMPPPPPPSSSPPSPPPPAPPVERVIVNHVVPPERTSSTPSVTISTLSRIASYSIASLQQYTESFREENIIAEGRLGKVYFGEQPDGKLLAVMKLDDVNSKISVDDFLDLVLRVSELRHPNILELVGYCAEHELRLLVYNYFSRRNLHDILHGDDELRGNLSWNARLQMALGAAKALEYLHELQPPIVHQDFELNNALVNDELAVRVAHCGLASVMSSDSVAQLSSRMRALLHYEAPEVLEYGAYSARSDVYSFGVVMLELLTGRQPYDSSLPRPEQHLVRWANSQLYDLNGLSKMVDPSIGGNYSVKSLSRFADIISRCIQQGPEFRPQMSEVVQDLTRMVEDSRKPVTERRRDASGISAE
ncbi:hypothetical protein HPP92_011961 [Vanilla planifolia]|uniref:Protein kinase domain-containing protein n=1 Tax=Vanilla planifolia TaxID=51239 RepID=A0A835V3A7_VANPL|nr:hypothetical protein HPP92_011961 [Vanilla planifolia]